MSNVYFGSYLAGATGNWNTVGNWYSNPGSPPGACCCGVPGTPLGRVPNASTDTVILFSGNTIGGNNPTVIATGPTGGYSGSITWIAAPSVPVQTLIIGAGDYSGTVTINQAYNASPMSPYGISGGNFSGNVILNGVLLSGSLTVSGNSILAEIAGGTFTDSVTRGQWPHVNKITGGTYSPVGTATQTGGIVDTVPVDPGFAAGGGVFSPQITITNLPDILGAGLPA